LLQFSNTKKPIAGILISKIITKAQKAVAKANDLKDLDDARVLYLGKKGELTALLKGLGKLPKEERPVMGEPSMKQKLKYKNSSRAEKMSLRKLTSKNVSLKKK